MSPVGPNDGLGGQHGFPRWADYGTTAGTDIRAKTGTEETWFEHEAIVPAGFMAVRRAFKLEDSALTVSTTIMSEDPLKTSLGHHDYYTLEAGKYEGLTINGQPLDDLLEEKGATEAIMNGDARFWPHFGGHADVQFPAGRQLRITANAQHERLDRTGETGMMLWRRPDAPYICLEPVLGVEPTGSGLAMRELHLDEMGSATLQVRSELIG
jgi:galactose mutarotase-like enzyme